MGVNVWCAQQLYLQLNPGPDTKVPDLTSEKDVDLQPARAVARYLLALGKEAKSELGACSLLAGLFTILKRLKYSITPYSRCDITDSLK